MLSGIFNNLIIITEINVRFYLVVFIERMWGTPVQSEESEMLISRPEY